MDPRKNATRGYRQRESRRQTAAEWQQQFPNPPKEGEKMFKNDNPNRSRNLIGTGCGGGCLTILAALVLLVLLAWLIFWNPLGIQIPHPAEAQPTQAPAYVAPVTIPTVEALAPTAAPTIELHKPAQLQIVKVNGTDYGTDFDNRIAFTNGEILTGHTAPYSDGELTTIQKTWVEYTIEMPANAAFPVAFGYTIDLENGKTYSPGAIIMLPVDQGVVKVKILDGELILWRSLDAMHKDISDRISTEIKNGNLSIKGPLAFSWVSQEFTSYVPQELLTARKVQIVK